VNTFLELDPERAAHTMTQLAILAAEDTAIALATEALDILHHTITGNGTSAGYTAAATVAAFRERITAARSRAWICWTSQLVDLLTDAGVLLPRQPQHSASPRTWTRGILRLPASGRLFPAQIARRRHIRGTPILRVDTGTCRQLAATLSATEHRQLRPTVLADRDRPVAVFGATNIQQAWRAGAEVICADADGMVTLTGRAWPWQIHRLTPAKRARRRFHLRHLAGRQPLEGGTGRTGRPLTSAPLHGPITATT